MIEAPAAPHQTSPISISLEWNEMPANDRTHMIGQWIDQTSANSETVPVSYPEIPLTLETSNDFWEKGWVAPMRKLPEVLDNTQRFPEKFNRRIFYNPKTFACPITPKFNYCLHATPQMPEGQAIRDLASYFDTVSTIAEDKGDTATADKVKTFKSELGYLSETDFDDGSEVIARSWIDYLAEHPDEYINVFVPESNRPKSNSYTFNKVMTYAEKQTDILPSGAQIMGRIRVAPYTWKNESNSKLVILDDWVISGGSSSEFVKEAKQEAQKQGIAFAADSIEVHTVARSTSSEEPEGYTYRTVFLQNSGLPYRDVSMTGAHCTVNYGYEHQIHTMQSYLQSQGVYIETPHLFKIQPSEYRAGDMRKLEKVADPKLIDTISRDNRAALKCLQRIADLDVSIQTLSETLDTNNEELETTGKKRLMYTVLLDRLSQRRTTLRKVLGVPKGV